MTPMQAWQTQSLITLVITAVVVVRFIRRELKARIVKTNTLWIRPGVLLVLLALSVFGTLRISQQADALLAFSLAGGAICGAITGILVVRATTFSATGIPGAVRAHGSRVTATVWVGAILLRLIARFLVPHSGQAAELAVNSGLIALVAVAFIIVAVAFQQAIGRFAGVPAVTTPVGPPETNQELADGQT